MYMYAFDQGEDNLLPTVIQRLFIHDDGTHAKLAHQHTLHIYVDTVLA